MSGVNLGEHTHDINTEFPCLVLQMYSFRVVYLFSRDPHKDVTFTIHRDLHYSFLPDWYVRELTKTHPHAQPQF